MNRCDVPALQRKELERTSKDKPYSLQTVGYGWVRICGVGCENLRRLRTVKWLVRMDGVQFAKKTTVSAYAKSTDKEKLFLSTQKFQLSTTPQLTCNNPFRIPLATVSLQKDDSFSQLRSLALAVRLPFRTDSNPPRRYPERLQFPAQPVT